MKKNRKLKLCGYGMPGNKIWLTMKLTVLLLVLNFIQVTANVYSQNSSFSLSKEELFFKEALKEIESQTDFRFAYSVDYVNNEKLIKFNNKKTSVNQFLDFIQQEMGLNYLILEGNLVVITSKDDAISTQNYSVKGKITDTEGNPLPGVNVVEKGTTNGTVTNLDGEYTINVSSPDAILSFSYVGYLTEDIDVSNRNIVNITLVEDIQSLEEVVVVGYGTMKKSDLTGSVSQVKSEELNAFPTTNVFQALNGRSSGVQVMQSTGAPGASVSIRIRGANSIQGSNEPLYVVDGFPVNNATALNNSDIESIEILKDASSTAIYGSRGANGVVLITTKKGKTGGNIIDFESSYSLQSIIRKLDLMDATEYATLYNIKATNDGVDPYFSESEINSFGEGFDWQDFIYQTAPTLSNSLNINGGNEKTKFSISGSSLNQDGIIKGSDYDRYSIRSNVDHQFSKKFSAVLSTTFTHIKSDRKDSGGGLRGNSLISAQAAPPTLTPYNDDGSYSVLATAYSFLAPDLINPLNFINEQTRTVKANIALINAALIYHPTEDLTLKVSGGMENRDDRTDAYTTRDFLNSEGSASASTGQFTSLLNENTISYDKTFNNHNISALAGFTYQNFVNTSLSGSGSGFLSDIFETYDLGAAITPGIPGSGYSKSVLLSYLGRINYNFKSTYYLTMSYRADGSSKFSEGNKWGYFPSAALAWRISEEDFLKNIDIISNLKLRTSWGSTGSQAIGPYVTLNQLSSGKTVFNDALYNTFAPGTSLPGDLKWETTEQMDIGFDLGLKNNRFTFSADYYVKNTKDLLNTVVLPSSLGFTSTVQNVGKVENKGLEFNLDARIVEKEFNWYLNANISFNRNKVVKLSNGEDILGGYVSVVALQDYTNILREGRPIGQFWGYIEDGYDENGKIEYKDLEVDETLTAEDKTYLGDANPDFIYGLNSNMSYKNFELNIFIQGIYGNDLFNLSAINYAYDYVSGLNMLKEVIDNSWTPENTDAKYPIISRNTSINVSDRFIEDGSYLRLKNIQLAYNLPLQKIGINVIQSVQFYVSGQNLLTLTNYSGSDPEVNSTGFGIDNKTYPNAKSVTFGVRARF